MPSSPRSIITLSLKGRCPHCGVGRLFNGFLDVKDMCPECGFDFGMIDSGDGPAVFAIFIAGFLIVIAALYVELAYQPAYWIHVALWFPLGVAVPLALLRPLKAWLFAMQYRYKAHQAISDK